MTLLASLLLSCGGPPGGDGAAEDPAATTTPASDPCAVELGESGLAVGEANCTDGVCEVPAGSFVMGADLDGFPDQCPPRRVELSAFAIDETEITRSAWASCEAAGACPALPACPSISAHDDEGALPATCVTWDEAQGFCAWAGGRLPTEAEWEKAARGTDGAPWAWGPVPPSCLEANFRFSSATCYGGVIEVGRLAAPDSVDAQVSSTRSAYGLVDTVGNAWEWVADWYDARYYQDAPDVDPPGPEQCAQGVDAARGTCRYRVIRGGGYNVTQDATRGSARASGVPELRDGNLGFRCAYDR